LLDDVVEHELGTSSVELLNGAGLDDWREAEGRALAAAVRSNPPAFLALGEGALTGARGLSLVLAETDLVYLYLSLDEACRRVVAQAANRKATLFAELAPDAACFDDELRRLYRERRAIFERAHHSVDAYRGPIQTIGAAVLAVLDRD